MAQDGAMWQEMAGHGRPRRSPASRPAVLGRACTCRSAVLPGKPGASPNRPSACHTSCASSAALHPCRWVGGWTVVQKRRASSGGVIPTWYGATASPSASQSGRSSSSATRFLPPPPPHDPAVPSHRCHRHCPSRHCEHLKQGARPSADSRSVRRRRWWWSHSRE